MANLEIGVGWDNSELERGIQDAERQLQTLERRRETRVRIGADTSNIDQRIQNVNTRLTQLRTNLNQTAPSIDRFNRSAANGSNTLTQFSRIAQDAPFGIIGIGNNLTATAEAFANLSRSAGGARGALQAVGQSLLGGGGILLAISLVTTGLTIMSQKGLTVSDVFAKITGTFDESRRSMQELNAESIKGSQAQISTMNAYVAVAKNVSLSMNDRLLAVKKLQDEYPGYFGNLTKEQILNGNVATAVKEVTAALIAKAKASALTDRIVKLAEEEEKIQSKINNQLIESARQAKLSVAQTNILAGNFKSLAENGGDFMQTVNKVGKEANIPWLVLNGTIVRVLQGFTDLGSELRNNKVQQDRLTGSLEEQTAAQMKLETVKEKAAKKTDTTPKVTAIPTLTPVKTTDEQLDKQLQIMKDSLSEDINKLKTVPIDVKIPIQPVTDTSGFDKALIPYYKMFYEFTKNVDDLVTSSISSTFENLGTSIAEALRSGSSVFGAIGKTLISSMGAFLSEMGSLLIKYGTLAVAKGVIDKALSSGNPIVTVAAGVAAIAVGVALKGIGSSISAKANQGSSGSSSGSSYNTGASYSSPASSSSSGGGSSSFGSGTVVFEISGQSLIGVLSNTLDANSRLGGALGI